MDLELRCRGARLLLRPSTLKTISELGLGSRNNDVFGSGGDKMSRSACESEDNKKEELTIEIDEGCVKGDTALVGIPSLSICILEMECL